MAISLEQIAGLLVGSAFGARALNGERGAISRVGYALVGYDLISGALAGQPLMGPQGAQKTGLVNGKQPSNPPPKFEERVKYVHEQAVKGTRDPQVYSLAREILSRKCGKDWCVAEKDHWGEAVALFNEVKSRVRYTFDPLDYDAFQTPAKTLQLKTGDCDDYMSLLGAMCRSVGLKVRSRIVQTTGNTTWNHIYLMVFLPERNGWASMDLSVKQPAGWQVPKNYIIRSRDFDIEELSAPKLGATNFTATLGTRR